MTRAFAQERDDPLFFVAQTSKDTPPMMMNDPGASAGPAVSAPAGAVAGLHSGADAAREAALRGAERIRLCAEALGLRQQMTQTARQAQATLGPARQQLQQHISAWAVADTDGEEHDLRPLALSLLDYTLAFEGAVSDLLTASAACLGAVSRVVEVTDEEICASAEALVQARTACTAWAALGGQLMEMDQQ